MTLPTRANVLFIGPQSVFTTSGVFSNTAFARSDNHPILQSVDWRSVNVASAIREVIFTDPFGVVFDSVSNNLIQAATVTIYTSAGVKCVPGAQIALGDLNPQVTNATGTYNFNCINGDYYITVSATGYY